MKKKFFRSIAHYLPQTLLLISLLTSNVLFPAIVIAQEVENINEANTNTVAQEETVPTVEVDTSEDILEEGISTSIYEQESIPEIQIPPFTFENGIYTVNNVIPEEEYIYPENDNVRVKFTEVTQEGNLVIKRVELTKEQKELLNTKDNYGWDITSSMDNGTFKYDLTLPNIYDNTNVEVKYTQDGNNYNSIQSSSINNNRIVIEGLDHFTMFVTTQLKVKGDIGTAPSGEETIDCPVTIKRADGTGKVCFSNIQEAINDAEKLDVISVESGTYKENIDIKVDNITITSTSVNGAKDTVIAGSGGETPVVKFSSNGSTLQGFTIDNNGGQRAIAPQASLGTNIKNNIIINSVRGIQGDWNGRPTNLYIFGNTFEKVQYGIAGTEGIVTLKIEKNTFKTSVEAIGLGEDVKLEKSINELLTENTYSLSAGYAIGDYRAGTLQPTKYTAIGYLLVENGDSIQKVINVSSNGDTIQVGTGTFRGGIVINKSITLRNGSLPKIDCGGSGVGITVNAPNVTIDGFEFTNCNIGIRSYGGPSNLGSLTINNSKIYKNTENGILLVNDTFETVNLNNLSIYENGGNGIGLGKITVTQNINAKSLVIEKSKYHGLFISESTIGNLDVVNSVFRESQTSGYSGITIGTNKSTIKNLSINKTTFNDNNGAGISIIQAAHQLQNILITNSQFVKNMESGIVFGGEASSQTVNITDSVFQSNKWEDIDLTGGWWGGFSATNASILRNNFLSESGYKIYIGSKGSISKTEIKDNNFYGAGIAVYNENTIFPDLDSNWWNTFNNPSRRVFGNGEYTYWLCQPYQTTWISQNGECKLNAPQNLGWNVSSLTNNPGETPVKLSCGSFTNDNTPSHVWGSVTGNNIKYQRQAKAPSGGWWTDPNVYTNIYTPFTYFGQSGQGNGWEGEWNSRVRAFYDENGNGVYDDGEMTSDWSDECTITYDKTAPTGSIASIYYPSKSMSVASFITNDNTPILEGTCSDTNLNTVKLTIDGENEQTPICNSNTWRAEPTTSLSDGSHTATLTITDKAGNTFTTTQTLFIDTKAPSAVYTYYKNGIAITGTKTFVKAVSELSFTAVYTDDLPSSGILKDSYVIFDSNADGSARTSKAYCAWRDPNNTVIIPYTGTIPFTNCEPTLPDGKYFMYHQVYDNATRQDIPTITQFRDVKGLYFIVDTQAPTSAVSITGNLAETKNLPHNNGWNGNGWYHDFAEVKLSISSGSALDPNEKILYTVLDGDVSCPGTLTDYTEISSETDISSTINSLSDGVHTLCYQAKDSAGNLETVKKETLKLDKTLPTYEVSDISGNNYNNIYYIKSNTISFKVNGKDTHSGYYRTRYDTSSADENWNCIGSWADHQTDLSHASADYTQELSISGLADGKYCLKVWVYDDVQNSNYSGSVIRFVIDTQKPNAPTLKSPVNNSVVNGSVLTNEWEPVSDAVKYFYESYNDEGATSLRFRDTYTTTSKTAYNVEDTTFWWRVKSVDAAGNESDWSELWKVTVDNIAPLVKITSPSDSSVVKGIIDIKGYVTDENLSHYNIAIYKDGDDTENYSLRIEQKTEYTSMFSEKTLYSWNTTNGNFADGTYQIRLAARDKAGNRDLSGNSKHVIKITVDNTAPTISGHSNITLTEGDTFPTDTVSLTDNYGISKVCGKGKDITNNIETSEICIDTDTTNLTGAQFTLMDVIREQIEEWKGKPFTTVDLSIIPAGQYQITYYAFDKAGNKGNEETFTITIEDNIPAVSITAPTTQITQGSSVVLGATVTSGNSPYTYLWGGACTGTEQTTTFTSASTGTYTCTVTVTDADGDSASSSIDITVGAVLGEATGPTEPTVKGATTTKTTTKKTTTTALTTTQDTETTPEVVDTSIEEKSVLGATCENKKKVSGYVYIDKNKDEEMNNDEKGIKEITLTIQYTDEQGNIKTEEEVTTDEKGYWETQLCSGKYNIVVKEDTLPKNIQISETLSLTVSDNEKETVFNIQAVDTRNFWQKYWYIIVGGIAVILIGITSIKNKKKEEV